MAYVASQDTDQDQTQKQQGAQGSTITTGSPSAARPTSSGQFTNIQNYLRANQGTGLGQQIQQNISGQAQETGQGIQQAQQQTTQQQQQAFQPFQGGQAFVNQMIQNAGNHSAGMPQGIQPGGGAGVASMLPQSTIQQAATSGFTPDQLARFKQISQGQYSGPADLANYGNLQQNVQNTQQLANLGNTEAGRFALLRNMYSGGGGYSQGQQSLDALLLQQQGGTNLAQAKVAANQAAQQLAQARGGVQNQAQQYAQQVQQASQAANTGLSNAQTTLQQNLQNTVTQDAATQAALYKQYKGALGNVGAQGTTIDPALLNQIQTNLGLSPEQALYNVNPLTYIAANPQGPTMQTVATPADYARYQALQQLAGTSPTLLTDTTQAETYKPIMFNQTGFQNALKHGQDVYTQDPTRIMEQGAVSSDTYAQDLYKRAIQADTQVQGLQQQLDAIPKRQVYDSNTQRWNSVPDPTIAAPIQKQINDITSATSTYMNSPDVVNSPYLAGTVQNVINAAGGGGASGPSWWQDLAHIQGAQTGLSGPEAQHQQALKDAQTQLGYFQKLKAAMAGGQNA